MGAPGNIAPMQFKLSSKSQPLEVASRLRRFNAATEAEFLPIGRQLQEFSGQCRHIASSAVEASRALSAERLGDIIAALEEAVAHLHRTQAQARADSASRSAAISPLPNLMTSISTDLEALRRTSQELRTLGITTRVHSAHLARTDEDFDSLGIQIKDLSMLVRDIASHLIRDASSLPMAVESMHHRVRAVESAGAEHLSTIVEAAESVLLSLRSLAGAAQIMPLWVVSASEQMSRSIDEVVVAVQYQDITHQEMERIAGAVTRLDEPGEVSDVQQRNLRTQYARQLRTVKARVVSAGDGIGAELDTVAGVAEQIISDLSTAHNEAHALMDQIEPRIAALAEEFAKARRDSSKLVDAIGSLTLSVSGMSGYAQDIESVAGEIELVAINAQIHAAQRADEGAAMDVIAMEIQRVAERATALAGSLLDQLGRLETADQVLAQNLSASTLWYEQRLSPVAETLSTLMDQVRAVHHDTASRLASTDAAARAAASQIAQAAASIRGFVSTTAVLDDLAHRISPEDASSSVDEDAPQPEQDHGVVLFFDSEPRKQCG